jgi:hypothetical protein
LYHATPLDFGGVFKDPHDHEDIRRPMPTAIDRAIAFIDRNTRHPMRGVGLNRQTKPGNRQICRPLRLFQIVRQSSGECRESSDCSTPKTKALGKNGYGQSLPFSRWHFSSRLAATQRDAKLFLARVDQGGSIGF